MLLSEQRLLGTYVLVMAAEALCPKIRHVQSAVIPTGLGVSARPYYREQEKGFVSVPVVVAHIVITCSSLTAFQSRRGC